MSGDAATARRLRQAMRGMAQSVVLVTTAFHDRRYAMVATAVCPLSLDPPAMLMCIDRAASAHRALSEGAGFHINLLRAEHEALARLCSGPAKGEERFARNAFAMDGDGLPYLVDAQANIRCVRDRCVSYGTHDVIFGSVKYVRLAQAIEPLLYFDGAYTTLAGIAWHGIGQGDAG